MKILLTGSAGFIGFHLSLLLLNNNNEVHGIDNMNNYYDKKLKLSRNKILKKHTKFYFYKIDINQKKKIDNIIKKFKIKYIVHLAGQAGVRDSVIKPKLYFKSNIEGFYNILEICRDNRIKHLVFASSSSVYGNNNKIPFKEDDNTDQPLSFYAASKKTNETMSYAFSNIYKIPITGLRFFTVYGPYGRPDMSLYKFSKNILHGKKIDLYNNGNHIRDFTYIEDVVSIVQKIIKKIPSKKVPFSIYNIGSGKPKKINDYIKEIQKQFKKKIKVNNLPLQLGDVLKTHSSNNLLNKELNYKPKKDINYGISRFIKWFKKYHKIN